MRNYLTISLSVLTILFVLTLYQSAAMVSERGLEEQKLLVIRAKSPDVRPSFPKEEMRKKYFVKLDRYLKNLTYNEAWITGKLINWYDLLPGNRSIK